MKKTIYSILLFFLPLCLMGQTVEFTYDNAGNRIRRETIANRIISNMKRNAFTQIVFIIMFSVFLTSCSNWKDIFPGGHKYYIMVNDSEEAIAPSYFFYHDDFEVKFYSLLPRHRNGLQVGPVEYSPNTVKPHSSKKVGHMSFKDSYETRFKYDGDTLAVMIIHCRADKESFDLLFYKCTLKDMKRTKWILHYPPSEREDGIRICSALYYFDEQGKAVLKWDDEPNCALNHGTGS